MRVVVVRRLRARCSRVGGTAGGRERGQISVLILGMCTIVLMLILGGLGVTAAQISRIHLMDAADGAALDAADALARDAAYREGVPDTVRVSDATVRKEAADYLSGQPLPKGVSSWSLAAGSGTPDGRTAVVRLQGHAQIPVIGPVLDAFSGGVTITVESRARADVQ